METTTATPTVRARMVRLLLAGLAVMCFVVGWVALWVPGLPTTVFWLAAAWLATKSCPVVQRWVYRQGRAGASVRMMVEERALTAAGKRRALLGMSLGIGVSIVLLGLLGDPGPVLVGVILGAGLVGAACIVFGLRTCTADADGESHAG